MASPKTVGQFYVETTRQTVKDAESIQDAGRRYMEEIGALSRSYYASLAAMQQSALQVTFALQNSLVEASRTVLDATIQANNALFDQWARALADGQAVAARMTDAGVALIEDALPARPN